MDLVYLYGPPAVGKFSVAREIAARTGYGLFHNHLSIDCVRPIFEFGTDPFWRQVHAIREGLMGEAARENRDLIFTTVYARGESDPQTLRRFHAVESNGGRVCPVQLACSDETREQRVVSAQRVEMNKIATVEKLRSAFVEVDLLSQIPGRQSLRLDTTDLSAAETAQRIIEHYNLPTVSTIKA